MPHEKKRARRRRDQLRMIAKARRIRPDVKVPQKEADNLAMCSCWMCGNPRRYEKHQTLQERKTALRFHDWDE